MKSLKDSLKQFYLFIFSLLVMFVFLWGSIFPVWQNLGVFPHFLILILFNWILYRTDLVTIGHILVIGLLEDGLFNYPLGFSILHLLFLYAFLMRCRPLLVGVRFLTTYTAFCGVAFVDGLLSWGMLTLYYDTQITILPFLKGSIITILLYPIVSILSLPLQNKLNRFSS